jgi:Pyruvate/2-oxoacid:ferredoxin oxidoreductase delta subunit
VENAWDVRTPPKAAVSSVGCALCWRAFCFDWWLMQIAQDEYDNLYVKVFCQQCRVEQR